MKYGSDLEDKIAILNLNENRVSELKRLKLKDLPFDPTDDAIYIKKTINSDKIVGVYRPLHAETWLGMLDSQYCHKTRNFQEFETKGLAAFKEFLSHPSEEDLPIVIQYNNEYYIAGEGLHRLTIAKCIGNIEATVIVEVITFGR